MNHPRLKVAAEHRLIDPGHGQHPEHPRRRGFCASLLKAAAAWPVLVLCACGGGGGSPGGDNGDAPPLADVTYTVGGTITGLRNAELSMELVYIEADADSGSTSTSNLTVTGDGPFTFPTALPTGWFYAIARFAGDQLRDPLQVCDIENSSGEIADANVENIAVTCFDGYSVSVTVRGLEGTGLSLTSSPDNQVVPTGDDLYTFPDPFKTGDTYDVTIARQPINPAQECEVRRGSGVIAEANVVDVVVECDAGRVGGTVTGLVGTGLSLSLSAELEEGQGTEPDVESLEISEDGAFEFEQLLKDGAAYQVTIAQQPSDPEQVCTIDNAEGVLEGDVTDVAVRCPAPQRIWAFHDLVTSTTINYEQPFGEPLGGGDQTGGVVYDIYDYPTELSVPLGFASGLDVTELFRLHIDQPPTQGLVYSNVTGETYWLTVDSGPRFGRHEVLLDTIWTMRKIATNPSFRLLVSEVNFLGFLDPSGVIELVGAEPVLRADARLSFSVQVQTFDGWTEVYNIKGNAGLRGEFRASGQIDGQTDIVWEKVSDNYWDAHNPLWHTTNFHLNDAAGVEAPLPETVALMQLIDPIPVELDLSGVTVGQTFRVVASAEVFALNAVSAEGGIAVYLQDPGAYDPGDPSAGASVSVVEMTGLELLPPDDGDAPRRAAPPIPAECADPAGDQSVLELSAANYELFESEWQNYLNDVFVTRDGTSGDVAATLSIAGGTAVAGEDFLATERRVVFGNTSDAPRKVDFDIVDDNWEEGDETFTITLHSPLGCAEIGPQNTATVTILANDPSPGTISFVSGSYEVSESAGVAEVTLQRVGGDFGIVAATLTTADGTAVSSVDYGAVVQNVVFQDGDSATQTVQIPILDNTDTGPDRTVLLSLISADATHIGVPSEAVLTIRDDEQSASGALQFTESSYVVAEDAGAVSVEIRRVGGTAGAVTVDVSTIDGTATAGEDYEALLTTVSFGDGDAAPKLVDLVIIDDLEDEADQTFDLVLSNPTGGAILGVPATIPVVIGDNDGLPALPPGPPVLSTDAAPKELRFEWDAVPEVSYYRLFMDPTGVAGFEQVGGNIPLTDTQVGLAVAAHLLDWANARFLLQACNSGGCTDSNTVDVTALMLGTIGFFKASNTDGLQQRTPDGGDLFGWTTALSGDGRTLVVTAYDEDSSAVFLNGDQSDNSATDAGAVYVFVAGESGWSQQAYIKASNTNNFDRFGSSLALSADGNTLAIGAAREGSDSVGVGGDQSNTGATGSGAVYVYVRSGTVWSLQAYVKASNTGAQDEFGHALALSADGSVLAVGALGEASAGDGVNADQTNNDAPDAGAVYIFTRNAGAWAQRDYLKASNSDAEDRFGHAVALSADGTFLAVAAPGEDSAATGINGDRTDNSASGTGGAQSGAGAVYVFVDDNGQWLEDAYIKASNTDADDLFGSTLDLSADGELLAVGARREDSNAIGVDPPGESDNSAEDSGAVYVFNREIGQWAQRAYLKASNTDRTERFGGSLSLSADGFVLAVGAEGEDSIAVGINGDQTQGINVDVGAAYVFTRVPLGDWTQTSYVKATNSDQSSTGFGRELSFGVSVSLSDDGQALAVGAYRDNSDATGINGDEVNEDARQSGAVFLY